MIYQLTTDAERIKFAREGGEVRRCHTQRIIGEYDVAQHCYGMLCILRILEPKPSIDLIWAILAHDSPERLIGDIPRPAKWAGVVNEERIASLENEILKDVGLDYKLTPEENSWLEGLDIVELWLWTLDQDNLGNKNILIMKNRIEQYILKTWRKMPPQLITFFNYVRANGWNKLKDLGD